jgi:hypothetical protein
MSIETAGTLDQGKAQVSYSRKIIVSGTASSSRKANGPVLYYWYGENEASGGLNSLTGLSTETIMGLVSLERSAIRPE